MKWTRMLAALASFTLPALILIFPVLLQADGGPATAVFHLPAPPSTESGKVVRYRTLPPSLSEEDVKRLGAAFGLDAPIEKRERQYLMRAGERVLEVFHQPGTGYIRFSDNAALDAEKIAKALPSPEKAVATAQEFLSVNGLLPPEAGLSTTAYYESGQLVGKEPRLAAGDSAIAVIFGFRVDDLAVKGPGAKAGLVIGDDGAIIGASLMWRVLEPEDSMEILSPALAFERFKRIWPPENLPSARIRTDVHVERIEPCYYAGPALYPQDRLEPMYSFQGWYAVDGKLGDAALHEKESFEILIPAAMETNAAVVSTFGPDAGKP